MSREFREIVCMNCFDVFTVNTETNHPWKCTKCREPIEATIGQWHDYTAMNANEVVFDPTPEESDRILRESVVEFGCGKSSPEEDLDNDLIADLKQQLDTALADLENEREAGDAMMKQLDETAGARDFWYQQAMAGRQSVAALDKIYNRTWRQRVRDWWTAATYAHSYGDRC